MTFRGSLPPGQAYNGQQQPYGQGTYPQIYPHVPPTQQLSQYPQARGSYPVGQVPHQQPQHDPGGGAYYGGNMMTANGNLNGMGAGPVPAQLPPAQSHYQDVFSHPPQQQPSPIMQYERQEHSPAHLPSPRLPAYQPHQHAHQNARQHFGSHFQQAQHVPQPLQYAPSPSPVATTPNTNANMGSNTNVNTPLTATATPSPAAYPYTEPARTQPSPKPTVAHSPALSARSSVISKRSPSMSTKAIIADPVSVLVCIAEECLRTARGNLQDVVSSSTGEAVLQYQKLIATALSCLEAALKINRLTPWQEAKIRLRYASVLYEDTENLMEAETTLSAGISLCDKHRFLDLKYSMTYLQAKLLFQRGHTKAALRAAEGKINELSARNPHWIYAFRFLKATFYLQSGTSSDIPALENLRGISALAHGRGDYAVEAFACLLEGLALLKTTKEDALDKVQECIARASKYQLDPLLRIPQVDILVLLLDLGSSMRQKNPGIMFQKLTALQHRLDAADDWPVTSPSLQLPIKKQPGAQPISVDTAAVIRPGTANDPQDYLVFSYVARAELSILVMAFSGLIYAYMASNTPQKSLMFLGEALETLERWNRERRTELAEPLASLQDAVGRARWRSDVHCYLHILKGLYSATHSKWPEVKESVDRLQEMTASSTGDVIELLALYLSGAYHQGTGELPTAMAIFKDPRFEIGEMARRQRCPRLDVSLLAAMNVLWIMEDPNYQDVAEASRIMERIRPLCQDHPDMQIRTSFNLIFATATLNPRPSLQEVKHSMSSALNLAKASGNTHCLAIALNIMRCKLFENVVGEQALKSAKAASSQAKKSGNLLWMSVADGMLAHSHEVQGQGREAMVAHNQATTYASKALTGDS